jgi:hypothetical protein
VTDGRRIPDVLLSFFLLRANFATILVFEVQGENVLAFTHGLGHLLSKLGSGIDLEPLHHGSELTVHSLLLGVHDSIRESLLPHQEDRLKEYRAIWLVVLRGSHEASLLKVQAFLLHGGLDPLEQSFDLLILKVVFG